MLIIPQPPLLWCSALFIYLSLPLCWLSFTLLDYFQKENKWILNVLFCSRVLPDKDELLKAAFETARTIAAKSPVAVQGTKMSLVYARDHSVPDSLQQVVCSFDYFRSNKRFSVKHYRVTGPTSWNKTIRWTIYCRRWLITIQYWNICSLSEKKFPR